MTRSSPAKPPRVGSQHAHKISLKSLKRPGMASSFTQEFDGLWTANFGDISGLKHADVGMQARCTGCEWLCMCGGSQCCKLCPLSLQRPEPCCQAWHHAPACKDARISAPTNVMHALRAVLQWIGWSLSACTLQKRVGPRQMARVLKLPSGQLGKRGWHSCLLRQPFYNTETQAQPQPRGSSWCILRSELRSSSSLCRQKQLPHKRAARYPPF